MRQATSVMLLWVLGCGLAWAAGSIRERLDKGEVVIKTRAVEGSTVEEATAMGVIDAPPAKVWSIIEDCGHYVGRMPRVKEAEFLGKKGDKILCRVRIGMPALLPDLVAVTEAVHTVTPTRYKRAWRLVEGNYKVNVGSWTLARFNHDPERTLAVYRVHAVPDFPVPAAILKMAQERSLPNLFKRLRIEVGKLP